MKSRESIPEKRSSEKYGMRELEEVTREDIRTKQFADPVSTLKDKQEQRKRQAGQHY